MNDQTRRSEFFALEATEYLGELERLSGRSETPDLERLVRGARALRGAALMAGLGTFARAAAALEGLARQVRDHAVGWDPDVRAGWREGVETLRGLVARAVGWESADDRHALLLADRIERIGRGELAAASTPVAPAATASAGLTPGVRAFIARESALIAGTLQEAARALAPTEPPVALRAVLDRLRALRGIGSSAELSPLPELLDAMEMTTRRLMGAEPVPPDLAVVFAEAADALSVMAQSVAEQGRAVIPPGLDLIARRLLEGFAAEVDVVPIDSLGFDRQPVLLTQGSPATREVAAAPIPIETVGVGDLLLMHAEALATQRSPTTRDLRLFVLHQTLVAMPAKSATGAFLTPIVAAITRLIASGSAHSDPDRFVGVLRECGRFLVDHGGDSELDRLTRGRDDLARRMTSDTPSLATSGDHSGSDEPPPLDISELAPDEPARPAVVDIGSLAPDESTHQPLVDIRDLAPDEPIEPAIVDIDSLAPDESTQSAIVDIGDLAPDDPTRQPIVSILDLAPDRGDEPSRLERAYRRLARLNAGSDNSQPAPVDSIDELLYRGSAALARIGELRRELNSLLSASMIDLDGLKPVLEELLDLVPLARNAA